MSTAVEQPMPSNNEITQIKCQKFVNTLTKFNSINFSKSNQQYSFGKGHRFPSVMKHHTHKIGYELPSTRTKRTCGFGVGHRFGTPCNNERNKSPEPGAYELKSDFAKPGTSQSRREKSHIYSFGISHEAYRKVYMPHAKKSVDYDLPGPGQYTHNHMTMGTEGKQYQLKGKLAHFADPLVLNIKQNVPGPGIYGSGVEMNKYGTYALSTMENSKAAAWSPTKQRFSDANYHTKDTPGPGNYNPSDYHGGLYITSKFKNRGSIQYVPDVARKKKSMRTKTETPGPGSYIAPSDFGHLDLNRTYQNPMGEFFNSKIAHSPRSQTSQGMRSTRQNSQIRTQSRARSRNDERTGSRMAYRSQLTQYNEAPLRMNNTITNGYPHPHNAPRKFETAKTLRLKRRHITITDGIVTPAMLCSPVKTPVRTPAAPSVQL